MSKHTAGPWHVGNKGADSVFTESGARLCTVMPRYSDPYRSSLEDFANARLIAAAPELLEACKAVVDSWESGDLAAAARQCSAAIAKIEPPLVS